MIVKQLIEQLESMPPDANVIIVYDSETCYTDALRVDLEGDDQVAIVGGVIEVMEDD